MNRVEGIIRLCSFVNDILEEETNANDEAMNLILDRHRKDAELTTQREKILFRLRSEIWEKFNISSNKWEIAQGKRPGWEWSPLSFPRIALVLGGDQSSWSKMLKVAENRSKKEIINQELEAIAV